MSYIHDPLHDMAHEIERLEKIAEERKELIIKYKEDAHAWYQAYQKLKSKADQLQAENDILNKRLRELMADYS